MTSAQLRVVVVGTSEPCQFSGKPNLCRGLLNHGSTVLVALMVDLLPMASYNGLT